MSVNAPAVAGRLRALDAAWFDRALRAGGHTEAAVTGAALEPVAFTGATTDLARVRLTYADAAAPGPATLIAKLRGDDEVRAGMDAAMGLSARESRFYSELAADLPVATPTCFHAGGEGEPLLLEDLGGLRMGDQIEGLSRTDAERIIDALADLHARHWNAPEAAAGWLASPAQGAFAAMIAQLVSSGAAAVAERFAGRAPDAILEAVVEHAPRWGDVLARGAEGPPTIAHNDCRLDNVFFRPDGAPVFVDWQVVARTRGTADVGNLLAGSMDADALSTAWEPLLRRYHERLSAAGVTGYGWDECVTHYRQSVLYPLGAGMALLGAMDIGDGRGLGEAIVLRALRHAADLDAFAAL
jgi:hypothetical protein